MFESMIYIIKGTEKQKVTKMLQFTDKKLQVCNIYVIKS